MKIKAFFSVLLAKSFAYVGATPYGAGSCHSGNAIPTGTGSPHPAMANGNLADIGIYMSLDGEILSSGASLVLSRSDNVQTRQLGVMTFGSLFRGFLIRASSTSGKDLGNFLIPNDDIIAVSTCESSVSGVTHSNNSDKDSVTVLFEDITNDTVLIEITAMENVNAYYYSNFTLIFTARPSMSPTKSPTTQPPTTSPTFSPTDSPTRKRDDGSGSRDMYNVTFSCFLCIIGCIFLAL